MPSVNRGFRASLIATHFTLATLAGGIVCSWAFAGGAPVIAPLVLEGDRIPDVGTVTSIDNIAISNSGTWLVLVDTDAATGDGVLLRNGVPMLRETDNIAPAPATLSSFDSISLNNTGEVGCNFFLANTGGPNDNSGVYLSPGAAPFTPALAYQESNVAPGLSPRTPFIGFFKGDVNDNRQMLIVCSVDDPAIATTVDRAIYRVQLDAAGAVISATLIAVESQLLPGQSEAVADFGTGPHNSAISDNGDVMFVADLTPTTATDGVVYRNSTLLAQEGSASPIAGRNWMTLSTSVRMDVNSTGGYVHTGTLAGDVGSDLVIVRNGAKVIQEGDSLPAIGGTFVFTAFGSGPVEIDDARNVLWFGDWNDVTTRDTGLFLNDQLLIQEGVTVINGQTIGSISNVQDGYHMSDDGSHIIVELTLFDGTSGAFMITFPGGGKCEPDINGSGTVDVDDLITVILGWGCTNPPGPCPADVNSNGIVDVDDLIAVILGWGACP